LNAYKTVNHLLASIDITRNGDSLEKIVETISSNIYLIAIDSDLFFTAEEDKKTFKRVKKIKENIFYHEIKSIHGHDAFLIENETVSQILNSIFNPKSNYSKLYESKF
jgi:homoserine O-acetyltransferase